MWLFGGLFPVGSGVVILAAHCGAARTRGPDTRASIEAQLPFYAACLDADRARTPNDRRAELRVLTDSEGRSAVDKGWSRGIQLGDDVIACFRAARFPDGSFRAASGEAARDDTLTLDFRDRLPEDDGPDARVLAAAIVPRRTALLGCTGGAPLLVDITAQGALTNLRVSRGQACAAAVVEGLPLPRSSRGRVDVAWP
jgi:hypothetical protein